MGNLRKKIKIFLPSLVNVKWRQPGELASKNRNILGTVGGFEKKFFSDFFETTLEMFSVLNYIG